MKPFFPVFTATTHRAALVGVALCLAFAASADSRLAAAPLPSAPSAPAPEKTVSEEVSAYDEPADRLVAETGEAGLAYRGWPLRLLHVPAGEKTAPQSGELTITEASGVSVARLTAAKPGIWWLSAEQSSRLPAGDYALKVGPRRGAFTLAEPPPTLSPTQETERRLALIRHARDTGDGNAARREATAWTAAADPRDPNPHIALGDVLADAGDHAGAYAAYRAAIDRLPGAHPPLALERKASRMLARQFEQLPVYPAGTAPPLDPETADAPHPYAAPVAPAPNQARQTPPAAPAAPALPQQTPPAPPTNSSLQWAASARAGSEYGATDWGAVQAAGAPNAGSYGDRRQAWTTRRQNVGETWLELAYEPAVERATGVRVFQNFNPGALMRIELIAPDGAATTVWTGPDITAYAAQQIGIFETRFPVSEKSVAKVKLTLDTARGPGWKQIDAVALLTAP
jgi:hypothetical protein